MSICSSIHTWCGHPLLQEVPHLGTLTPPLRAYSPCTLPFGVLVYFPVSHTGLSPRGPASGKVVQE